MRVCGRHCGLAVVMILNAAALLAQPALNPTVTVLPQAQSPVPAQCDEPMAPPPQPRLPVAETVPVPPTMGEAEPVVAARADLRSLLSEAHAAAVARDRQRFRDALAAARPMLAAAPPGAERNMAAEALSILDDVARLWDYQWNTPAGAFFDTTSEGGALLSSLTRYRGFEDHIRRQSIVDSNGVRHYPTREAMDFLLGLAGERLTRAGVRLDRTAEMRPRITPAPPTAGTVEPRRTIPQPAPARVETSTRQTPTPKAAARRAAPPRRTAPSVRRKSAPAAAPSEPESSVPPAVEEPPVADLTLPPPIVATQPPSDTATVDPTAMTATVDRTATAAPAVVDTAMEPRRDAAGAEPRQARKRSVIMPIMLILIGVGVLILLFRASS